MKNISKGLLIFSLILSWLLGGWPHIWFSPLFPPPIPYSHATVSISNATGGSSISADTTGGSYTTLSGPAVTEGSSGDFPSTGTFVISAPSGFTFNTGVSVTSTITKDAGTGTCFAFTSSAVTPTSSSITFTINAKDSKTNTHCHVTFSNIQVRPSSGTPLATGSIAYKGTASITGLPSSTSLGTVTEVAGAKKKLAVTTQPSSTAGVGADFTTKPVVAVEDQFGNVESADNSTTITENVVLSTQSCGGTAGSGSLTSSPVSTAAVSGGVMTYTAMQYSAPESIKICFTSSGVTSALSSAITVAAISITITSSGTVSYGILPLNTSKDTTTSGLNNTQTAQNNSTIAEDFNIEGQNTACPWTLAATNGADQYIHALSINSGTSWTPLTTSYQTLASNIAASGTQPFDLKITTPTATSCTSQQSVNVTIQAVAH